MATGGAARNNGGTNDVLEDGPLFRATLASLEKRAGTLRVLLKKVLKQAEHELHASKESLESREQLDEALEQLCVAHKGQSDTLDSLWRTGGLQSARERQRKNRLKDQKLLEEVAERFKGSIARLKQVDNRKKQFESDSKTYDEATQKYLARSESDATQSLDTKHEAARMTFHEARLDYFSFVEGLVLAEESAVAAWLAVFAELGDAKAANVPILATPHLDPSEMSDGATSEVEEGSLSVSAGSAFSHKSQSSDERRRKRSSIGGFLGNNDNKRERFKDFIKSSISSAQSSFASALPSASSTPNTPTTPDSFALDAPSSPSKTVKGEPVPQATGYQGDTGRKKEGFLWATAKAASGINSTDGGKAWHKFWVVLSEGRLVEFTNWNSALSVHNPPINLTLATVRAAQSTERRFTFEVITPNLKRVYQAQSEEDAVGWVSAIARSIESMLNGTSSVRQFDETHMSGGKSFKMPDFGLASSSKGGEDDDHQATVTPSSGLASRLPSWMGPPLARQVSLGGKKKKSLSVGQKRASMPASAMQKPSDLTTPANEDESPFVIVDDASADSVPPSTTHARGRGTSESEYDKRIAELVSGLAGDLPLSPSEQKAHNAAAIIELARVEGNDRCADCGERDPRWASTNLGIFVCIRCSGIHRSLGTHISKVRSIDLDDWSTEQIRGMKGNAASNAVYEAKKPAASSDTGKKDDATMRDIIKRKYVQREWVDLPSVSPVSPFTPSTAEFSS